MAKREKAKKVVKQIDHDGGADSAAELVKALIEGTYFSRWRLFRINLLRGLAFGMGSFIGATALLVFTVWFLGTLSNIPGLGGLVDAISETIESR